MINETARYEVLYLQINNRIPETCNRALLLIRQCTHI